MAKKKLRRYVVDVHTLSIVVVEATSKTDAVKRVDRGEGDTIQDGVDIWAAGPRYVRLEDLDNRG